MNMVRKSRYLCVNKKKIVVHFAYVHLIKTNKQFAQHISLASGYFFTLSFLHISLSFFFSFFLDSSNIQLTIPVKPFIHSNTLCAYCNWNSAKHFIFSLFMSNLCSNPHKQHNISMASSIKTNGRMKHVFQKLLMQTTPLLFMSPIFLCWSPSRFPPVF